MVTGFEAEANYLKCALGKAGRLALGLTTVTLQRGETTVVIKAVPAEVCGAGG